ncbi:fructoselysine 6-kinase [Paenibacillus sp. alder61]|uniref:fructoselysine 6-kinase n=1 Tax=Paenibacillus sp. alder61 TaxID=2862948 RepID=UPI001CD7E877|nr:fructoselysine 6-kinase [Paenibacillus sp. alder61]MCA1291432.1 fructoselysine 6-kinase [Paenibacillus sp. alder61]
MEQYKVIGIGDNVVDKYVHQGVMYPGGNALNFSAYARMCGMNSSYLGKFGNDQVAHYIQRVLDELEIEHSRCRIFEGENGYARVTLEDGDRVFLGSNKGGIAKEKPWNFTEDDLDYIKQFSVIHTSLNSYIEEDLATLKTSHVPVSFDFSVRWNDEYLERVCRYADISFLSCSHITESEREREMRKAQAFGSKLVIGTVGENGSFALYKDQWIYQPAVLTETEDTMGAGDSYLTAFLIGMIRSSENGTLFADSDEEMLRKIKASMEQGAAFAAKICRINGAFGHGTAIL